MITFEWYSNIKRTLESGEPLPLRSRYHFRKALRHYSNGEIKESRLSLLKSLIAVSKETEFVDWAKAESNRTNDDPSSRSVNPTPDYCSPEQNYILYVYENLFGQYKAALGHRKVFQSQCVRILKDGFPKRLTAFPTIYAACLGVMDHDQLAEHVHTRLKNNIRKRIFRDQLADLLTLLENVIEYRTNGASKPFSSVVIGPAYDPLDPPQIGAEEIITRISQTPDCEKSAYDYNGFCHRVYVNAEYFTANRETLRSLSNNGNVKVFLKAKYARSEAKKTDTSSTFQAYTPPKNCFITGYANMGPSIAFSLLKEGIGKLRLSGLDFYTGAQLYKTNHYSASKKLDETLRTLRKHNLIENFSFVKILYDIGFIEPADLASQAIAMTIEDYAELLDKQIGKPNEAK